MSGALVGGPAALEAELIAAARAALPREACGLLLGRRAPDGLRWVRAHHARNLEPGRDRFLIHPADHLAAELSARSLGLRVLGAWHSHPRGPARPSAADRAGSPAGWWTVVVGFAGGGAAELGWFAPRSERAACDPCY